MLLGVGWNISTTLHGHLGQYVYFYPVLNCTGLTFLSLPGRVVAWVLEERFQSVIWSQRMYIYIWWHTVTVPLINAWICNRRDLVKLNPNQKPLPLTKFQASVGTSLTSAGKVKKSDRPRSSPEGTPWTTPQKENHWGGHPSVVS